MPASVLWSPSAPRFLLVAERLCYPRIAQRMRTGSNGKGRMGNDREDPGAAESFLGKDLAMVDAFMEMTKDGFGLADLSNGPVVEADYRSFRCVCLRYTFVDLAPKIQRSLLVNLIHWVQGATVSIDCPEYGFYRTPRRSPNRLWNNLITSRVSSKRYLEVRGGRLSAPG